MSKRERARPLQHDVPMRMGIGIGALVFAVLGASSLLVIGCSDAESTRGFDNTSNGSSSSGGFGSSGGFDTDGTLPASDGCSDAAKLVYVVSQENDLYSFAPNTTTFTKIGRLECPTFATPNSMAIDR